MEEDGQSAVQGNTKQPVMQGGAGDPKSNKTLYVILGIVLVVIVVGLIIFFVLNTGSGDKVPTDAQGIAGEGDGTGAELDAEEGKEENEMELIECDDIPADFDMQDETYLDTHPEVKENLLCIADGFKDCKDSSLTFLGEQIDNVLSIKNEDGKCLINYESGAMGLECEYSFDQTKMLSKITEDMGQPELAGLSLVFGMGMELSFGFEAGGTTEPEIINTETGEMEKIPCKYYNIGAGGECDEGKMCINGVLCLRDDFLDDVDDNRFPTGGFELTTRCVYQSRIYVEVKNLRADVLTKQDFEYLRIDGEEVEIAEISVPSQANGIPIFTEESYPAGDYLIEIKLLDGELETNTVTCPGL